MPGVKLEVEITGLDHVTAVLDRPAGLQDLTPAMRDIGEYLLNTTRERFSDQKDLDGTPERRSARPPRRARTTTPAAHHRVRGHPDLVDS